MRESREREVFHIGNKKEFGNSAQKEPGVDGGLLTSGGLLRSQTYGVGVTLYKPSRSPLEAL